MPQLAQLEDEHPEHELPVPATGMDVPELSLVNEANRERLLLAFWLQLGQSVSLFDSLIERITSNLLWQLSQQYSYIGILILFFTILI